MSFAHDFNAEIDTDILFKTLETDGFILSEPQSPTSISSPSPMAYNNYADIVKDSLPSDIEALFDLQLNLETTAAADTRPAQAHHVDDESFNDFYLANAASPLSEKVLQPILNGVDNFPFIDCFDDDSADEMLQEIISNSSPRSHHPFSPQTPYKLGVGYAFTTSPMSAEGVGPGFDFTRYTVDEILRMNLTIADLMSPDLLTRLIRDQDGSRFLQNTLNWENDENLLSLLLTNLVHGKHDLTALSEDRYGNYSMQILFEKGNERQHSMLMNAFMYANVFRLSQSEYGCRVVQAALRCVKSEPMLIQLVRNFAEQTHGNEMKLKKCLLDLNANHVIQAILNLKLPFETVYFVKVALEKNLSFYSEHAFACRIVQCFIKQYGDKLAVNKLFENNAHLSACKSMYGNYVIQCIIESNAWYSHLKGISKFRWKLITELFSRDNVLFLSKNKFGSNVMEACIKVSTDKQLSALCVTLCTRNEFVIREMVRHRFANYVIKTLLNCASKKHQMQLIECIERINYNNNYSSFGSSGAGTAAANRYCEILFHEIQRIKNSAPSNRGNNKNRYKRRFRR